MAQYEIPLSPLPAQEINIVLGEQECTVSIYMRGKYYYMDLAINGKQIYQGLICWVGNSLNPYPYRGFVGKLYFVDVDNKSAELDFSKFGERYFLIYENEA